MSENENLYIFNGDGSKPHHKGFEKVVDRKFTCKDCQHISIEPEIGKYYNCPKMSYVVHPNQNACLKFALSDETKAEIKLHDYELYPAGKIDQHPRYTIASWEYYTAKGVRKIVPLRIIL